MCGCVCAHAAGCVRQVAGDAARLQRQEGSCQAVVHRRGAKPGVSRRGSPGGGCMPMLCTQHTGLSTSMKVLVLDCVNSPLMKFGTLPPWPFTASQLIPRVCAWAPRHASACHNHNAGSASGELKGWGKEGAATRVAYRNCGSHPRHEPGCEWAAARCVSQHVVSQHRAHTRLIAAN
jgi:hypothetical protein